jgi:hypothetical protein
MAADAGSRQIEALLNKETPALNGWLAEIAKASKGARKNPYGVMSLGGVEAVAEVRRFYRDLRAQIAAIDTGDKAAKTGALQSLDALDASFGAYEQSLDFGISPQALPKAKNAERKGRQSKRRMAGVIARLSR